MNPNDLAITPHQQLERLNNRLHELAGWRDHARIAPELIRFTDAKGASSDLKPGAAWPSRDFPVKLEVQFEVPQTWAGQPVSLYADPGGEALLSVNGSPIGGVNPFHRDHPLLLKAKGGEKLDLTLTVSPKGLFGQPERQPVIRSLYLTLPDQAVRPLHHDLEVALDAARELLKLGREAVAQRVLDIVDRSFALVTMPREASAAYLARVSQSVRERQTLDGLWDEYDFEVPDALPYSSEDHPRLGAARDLLRRELDALKKQYPTEGQLALSGHAHIDLAWLWPLSETRHKVLRTFSTVLSLMDRYPDFKFNQSMGQLYEYVLEGDPAMFKKIQERVKEGRWDLVGGMWVEPDGNLLSAESWARQLLHGQRFFDQHFGQRAEVCWLPDTFGYAANIPQFLQQAGIPYFFTTKLTWNDTNKFPYDLYHWEALDGSRVIAHSFANPGAGYNGNVVPFDLAETWKAFKGKRTHDESLLSFGHGDGGGGPMWEMLENYERLKDFPGLPKLHMTTIADFYKRVDPEPLPRWVGEQYFELHRGTYTSQAKVKWHHRRLEHTLVEAEAACTLAARTCGQPYPREELYDLWKVLLRNQFHDILPGSSVRAVYEVSAQEMGEALQRARELRDQALGTMSARVPGSGEVAWNLSLDGRECRGVRVPPLGYARIPAAPAAKETGNGLTLENEFLKVTVNPDGTLGSLYDKRAGREALGAEADGRVRGNQLWSYVDVPRSWEAWDVDASYPQEGEEVTASAEPQRVSATEIEVQRRLGHSTFTQTYRLEPGSRRLDIETHAEWTGRRTLLRAQTRADVRAMFATFETAAGAVTRTTHTNTSWDAAQFEVPAHRWADLSEGNYGLALLNDSKYGHSVKGDVLGISLLRGPLYPDPTADEGEHHFTYSLYPHAGDWRGEGMDAVPAQAADLNAPLCVVAAQGQASHDWPESQSLLKVDAPSSLRLSALKLAEDDDKVLVRLYDAHGSRGRFNLAGLDVKSWQAVNLLEEVQAADTAGDPSTDWTFSPYRVVSLREA